jgi:hypothetical protein
MTANTNRFKSFRFGSKSKFQTTVVSPFNNPGTDKHHCAWLNDDEFVGLDSVALSRDLHVAIGYTPRGGFHE